MTIVRNLRAYKNHPFIVLTDVWREALLLRIATFPEKTVRIAALRVLTLAECFAQVCNIKLPRAFCAASAEVLFRGLLGAVHNPAFLLPRNKNTRGLYATFCSKLVMGLRADLGLPILRITPRAGLRDGVISEAARDFDRQILNSEAVWVWSSWLVPNKDGKHLAVPLYPIYEAFGFEFAKRLLNSCADYVKGRRLQHIPCLQILNDFIAKNDNLSLKSLQEPHFGERFWQEFWDYYQENVGGKESTSLFCWRMHFVFFAEKYLITPDLFPAPLGRFPGTHLRGVITEAESGLNKSKSSAGDDSLPDTILFDMPSGLHGDELWAILNERCTTIMRNVESWAVGAAQDHWFRFKNGRALSTNPNCDFFKNPMPTAAWMRSKENPNRFINAAYSYTNFGHFIYSRDNQHSYSAILPQRSAHETSELLGMATKGTLAPFAALLVIDHPEITDSFLINLEIYDDEGNLINPVRQDKGYYLVGWKFRRGERLSQIRIRLTRRSLRIIHRIIKITQPLRDWLRERNSPIAKRLFLECGRGRALPKVADFSPSNRRRKQKGRALTIFEERLSRFGAMSSEQAVALSSRLTLRNLRRTRAIQIFLETRNPYETSRRLGHYEYDPSLFARYVPPEISALAYELVIRETQTTVVAHATKGKTHALRSTGFKRVEDLRDFIEKHAFTNIENLSDAVRRQNKQIIRGKKYKSEIVFRASLDSVLPIACASAALKSGLPMSPAGVHLSLYATAIMDMLTARSEVEPSIGLLIEEARSKADIRLVREALCGSES